MTIGIMYIGVRVKRCGKSAPVPVATPGAVRVMGCKAKYIPVLSAIRQLMGGGRGKVARFAETSLSSG